mgnify:FL=1
MNTIVREKCDLLIKNKDTLCQVFRLDGDMMMLAGSSFYVGIDVEANADKIKYCEQILKKNTKMLSEFRGNVRIPVLCKMAIAKEPQDYLISVQRIVGQMKHLRWMNGEYKVLAAMIIQDHEDSFAIPAIIDKMTNIFHGMKETHPWLTSDEDLPFAAMLAVSDLDTDRLIEEMEACYQMIIKTFPDKNASQSLSHVLAIDPSKTVVKCNRIRDIFATLKERKHKFGTGYELAILGTMSMLEFSVEQIVEEIIEADDYLKTKKGFGNFTMGEKRRRMYAALMVMDAHIPPASRSHQALLNSTLALVIAMEICMILIMTAVITTTTN